MSMVRIRGLGLAVAAFLGFVCLAWGQTPAPAGCSHGAHGHTERHQVDRMIWELDLSPEQQATIHDLMERDGPRLRELNDVMRDTRRSIADLDTTDPAYAQLLAEASEMVGRTLTEIMQAKGQLRADIQALLTPEQREKARGLRQQFHDRMEARIQRPFERPPAEFVF